ncbi:JMY [Bugula neritina]|uniref:JMY n=1 Tax=Bugula neritina TaxID=10212 RepID=A0A7J7J841_BUGNE|nr:JMY [Bugula neritina]
MLILQFRRQIICSDLPAHSRTYLTEKEEAWTLGLGSYQLMCLHSQLCDVVPQLSRYPLPQLPYEPRGVWCFIYDREQAEGNVCTELEKWFQCAVDVCGQKLFLAVWFEEMNDSEYYDQLNDWKIKEFEEQVDIARERVINVAHLGSEHAVNLQELCQDYELEDRAFNDWCRALTALYNAKLHPFIDLREIANEKMRIAKSHLADPALGPRPKAEHTKKLLHWDGQYSEMQTIILDHYVSFYSTIYSFLSDMHSRMKKDQSKFGKASFTRLASSRLFRVEGEKLNVKLQHLRAQSKHSSHEITCTMKLMANIDSSTPDANDLLNSHENKVYELKCRMLDLKIKVLEVEVKLARLKKEVSAHNIKEINNTDEFFDAVEEESQLDQVDVQSEAKHQTVTLKEEITSLSAKISRLSKKQAQLRNQIADMEQQKEAKEKMKVQKREQQEKHHLVQKKFLYMDRGEKSKHKKRLVCRSFTMRREKNCTENKEIQTEKQE